MVFLTPVLLIYLALTAYPAARTFYNAFHIIKPRGDDEFIAAVAVEIAGRHREIGKILAYRQHLFINPGVSVAVAYV